MDRLLCSGAFSLRVRSLGAWLCGLVAHHRLVRFLAHQRYVLASLLGVSAFSVDCLAILFEAGLFVNIKIVVLV